MLLNNFIIKDKARIVVSALVAKIHTIDWTVELLKTKLLDIGMNTNWDGIAKAFGIPIPGILSKMGENPDKKANNQGTPFCLTEEFAAVYRLHSLSPPGLILDGGDKNDEFVRSAVNSFHVLIYYFHSSPLLLVVVVVLTRI